MNGLNLPIRDCRVPQEQERNGDLFRGGKGILPGQGSSFVPCRGVAFEVPGMQCVVQPWTVKGVTNMIKTQIRQAHAIERELGSDDAAIKGRITGRSWRRACAKALLRAGASQERAGQRMQCTGTNAAYYGTEESALFSSTTNFADVARGHGVVTDDSYGAMVSALRDVCRSEIKDLERLVAEDRLNGSGTYGAAESAARADMAEHVASITKGVYNRLEVDTANGSDRVVEHDAAPSGCIAGTATAAPIGDVMISAGELEMSSWQAGKFKRFPEEAQAVFDRAIAKFGGLWNVVVSQLEDEFPPSLPGYFAGRAPGLFKEKMKAMRNAARKAGNHPTASDNYKLRGWGGAAQKAAAAPRRRPVGQPRTVLAVPLSPVNVAREARRVRLQKMHLRREARAQSACALIEQGQRSTRSLLEVPQVPSEVSREARRVRLLKMKLKRASPAHAIGVPMISGLPMSCSSRLTFMHIGTLPITH